MKFDPVIVVLADAGPDREDIWVKNYVFWRKANFFSEKLVGALAYFNAPFKSVGLPFFIKGHDDHLRPRTCENFICLGQKVLLSLFQGD